MAGREKLDPFLLKERVIERCSGQQYERKISSLENKAASGWTGPKTAGRLYARVRYEGKPCKMN
jgi:hypothetical protein